MGVLSPPLARPQGPGGGSSLAHAEAPSESGGYRISVHPAALVGQDAAGLPFVWDNSPRKNRRRYRDAKWAVVGWSFRLSCLASVLPPSEGGVAGPLVSKGAMKGHTSRGTDRSRRDLGRIGFLRTSRLGQRVRR